MKEQLEAIRKKAIEAIGGAEAAADLESLRKTLDSGGKIWYNQHHHEKCPAAFKARAQAPGF